MISCKGLVDGICNSFQKSLKVLWFLNSGAEWAFLMFTHVFCKYLIYLHLMATILKMIYSFIPGTNLFINGKSLEQFSDNFTIDTDQAVCCF